MKISVIEFKDPTGALVCLRGVSVVTSATQFQEAVLQAFKELNCNELFLQLGVQGNPETYSKSIQEDIQSAYLELAVEQPQVVQSRLVMVVDPNGQLVMNGFRNAEANNSGGSGRDLGKGA